MFEIDWPGVCLVGCSSLEDPLEASIEKWEYAVAFYRKYPDTLLECGGSQTCALCQRYLIGRDTDDACIGCPVMQATGQRNCFNTPYCAYRRATDMEDPIAARLAAEEELEFLRSLR